MTMLAHCRLGVRFAKPIHLALLDFSSTLIRYFYIHFRANETQIE
jgi:hypothetical protein